MINRPQRPRTGEIAARASISVLLPIAIAACASSERSDVRLDPAEGEALTHADVVAHAERVSHDAVLDLSGVPAPMNAAPEPATAEGAPAGVVGAAPAATGDGDEMVEGADPNTKPQDATGTGSKAKGAPGGRQGNDPSGRPDERRLGVPRSAAEAAERGDAIGPNEGPPLAPAPPSSAVTPEAVSPTAPAETAPPR